MGTALVQEQQSLLWCFDAFRDDIQVQGLRHGDDGADDGPVASIYHQFAHEGLVNLELVDG